MVKNCGVKAALFVIGNSSEFLMSMVPAGTAKIKIAVPKGLCSKDTGILC